MLGPCVNSALVEMVELGGGGGYVVPFVLVRRKSSV